jgi:hypothetical protein
VLAAACAAWLSAQAPPCRHRPPSRGSGKASSRRRRRRAARRPSPRRASAATAATSPASRVPALTGDRFYQSWGGEPIDRLFLKIRDTMPPNFGTVLDDKAKLDVVTYILQTNGFPGGRE